MQEYIDDNVGIGKLFPLFENRSSSQTDLYHGYSNQAFPTTDSEILAVTYYDDYDFDADGSADYIYIEDPNFSTNPPLEKLHGQVTGTKIKVLGDKINGQAFYGSGTYSLAPSGSSNLYYKGESIVFSDGFISNSGQNIYAGSDIPIPSNLIDNEWLTSVTFQDKYQQIVQTQSVNIFGDVDIAYTTHDFLGRSTRSKLLHTTPHAQVCIEDSFEYDHSGLLLRALKRIDSGAWILSQENHYNELSQLVEQNIHSTDFDLPGNATFLQSVDYAYNEHGWLTALNNSDLSDDGTDSNASADMFGMEFHYNDGYADLAADELYSGKITAVTWQSRRDLNKRGYGYQFDDLYQLTRAQYGDESTDWTENDRNLVHQLTYDLHGNLLSIHRNKENNSALDELTYFYEDGNKLLGVDDAVTTSSGFDFYDKNGSQYNINSPEYAYDIDGNLIRDDNKGIFDIQYNHLHLPEKIDFGNGDSICYIYSAGGQKVRKVVYWGSSNTSTSTDYIDNFHYQDQVLDFIATGDGRIEVDGTNYEHQYNFQDQLGNVRMVFADGNEDNILNTSEIKQDIHYYPFGMQLLNSLQSGSSNKYLYNGKELNDEHDLNWYHYGARFYDPQLGRWHVVDPADEFNSPYVYVGNDPVNKIDPDGFNEEPINSKDGLGVRWEADPSGSKHTSQ